MGRNRKRGSKAEYIENGDFEGGKLDSWKVISGSVTVEEEDGRFHALLGAGSKLNQHFTMTDVRPRQFVVSFDIRVEGGIEEATGQVQFIWQYGTRFMTFNLFESPEWRTITIPVNMVSPSFSNGIEFLVQRGSVDQLSVTNVSVRDLQLDGAVFVSDKPKDDEVRSR